MTNPNRRVARSTAGLIVALMMLSACGSAGANKSSPAQPTQADAATTTDATTGATNGSETSVSGSAPEATNQAEASNTGSATPAPGITQGDAPQAPVPADDGCSADNSPTTPENADGPAPAIPVRTESVGNLLPDLALRRINCAGGWVNLKNELPAPLPLLVWFWAPH